MDVELWWITPLDGMESPRWVKGGRPLGASWTQDKTNLEEIHSLTTHTKIVHNFFTIISTCIYKGGDLLFIDLRALEKKKRG